MNLPKNPCPIHSGPVEEGDEVVISLNLAPEEEQKLLGDVEEEGGGSSIVTLRGSATDLRLVLSSDTMTSTCTPVTFRERWSPVIKVS